MNSENELTWQLEPNELENLKLVALGCHRSCSEAIEGIFRSEGIVSWSLNDYLLLKPLAVEEARARTKAPPAATAEKRNGDLTWSPAAESPQLYYPYFERRLREIPFIPDIELAFETQDEDRARFEKYSALVKDRTSAVAAVLGWPIKPNTGKVREHLRSKFPTFTSHLPNNTNGMALIRNWAYHVLPEGGKPPLQDKEWWAVEKAYSVWDIVGGVLDELAKGTFDGRRRNARKQNDLAAAVVEQAVNDHFWLLQVPRPEAGDMDVDCLVNEVVAVAIASQKHFYGYLVVQFPILDNPQNLDELRSKIKQRLREITLQFYRDVLVLYFNRVYEKRFEEKLKTETGDLGRLTKEHLPFSPWIPSITSKKRRSSVAALAKAKVVAPPDGPPIEVEDWLRWLWAQRLAECDRTRADTKITKKRLLESLILARMEIASPPMVERIKAIMNFGIRFNPQKQGLPSVLIIGGPGSGKDNTARLVPLFAEGYAFGELQTVNMAAIRPQAIVGPMLQGFEFAGQQKNSVFPTIERESEQKPPAPTVILDELNSLDIDQQGVLLRIFENSEVTPLFSASYRRAHFLCVGVMNESPEELMKESELRNAVARSGFFGNILGTFVEEMFRRARRLRPDLYYRMQRFGVITLPNLHERREDIPILVWSFLPKKHRDGQIEFQYEIELAAYERLMEKDLAWPGNIRELQAVTKRIVLCVEKELMTFVGRSDSTPVKVKITRAIVDEVLSDHLKQTGSTLLQSGPR